MNAKVSEPESWKRVVQIDIPVEEVDKLCEDKLREVKKDVSIDGFRPGKVPPALIRQRYGDAIRAEVVENLMSKSFKEVCTERDIVPVSQGKVTDMQSEEGKPFSFTLEFEVDPAIEIKGYQKLKIKVSPKKIKDDDVDEAQKSLIERFAEFNPIDRPTKKGDHVRLTYQKVVIDGAERTDVKSPTYPIELGAEHRIKDFDKGLIGHKAGDTVEISVKFPKDYADAEVAGKGGEFTILIDEVLEKSLPAIETILPKIGDFKDEAVLREQLRARLVADSMEKAKAEAHTKAIDTLIDKNPFTVPPAKIETFIDYVIKENSFGEYGSQPPSREEIDQKYRPVAERSLKRARILDYIADKEKILVTQEDVDAEIRRLAERYQQPFEEFKQRLRQDGTSLRIREDLREQKTLDFLVELPEGAEK